MQVLIVGAGVIGLGIAWRLASRGVAVKVLERDHVGAGASRAAAGMLAPTAEVQFEEEQLLAINRLSAQMYPDFVAELEEASGLEIDYRREGTLVVALDRDDAEALGRLHRYHVELGLEARWLDGDEARELEPGLSPNITAAVRCAHDRQVDPRALVEALAAAARAAGASVVEGCSVEAIHRGEASGRCAGVVVADGSVLEADVVVLAAGAWLRGIGGLAPRTLPHIRPVRGQMLAVELGEPALCEHVIRGPDAYLVPKTRGHLIVGATMEERGFDDRLTAGGLFELLRGAWEVLPGIYDQAVVETWTGFRPMSLSSAPVVGPSALDGLWLAAGHGRNGILLTPWTSQVVAQALAGEGLDPSLEPFLPKI